MVLRAMARPTRSPDLRPMSEFDPTQPAMVHDQLNDQTFEWDPEKYLSNYRRYAHTWRPGVIGPTLEHVYCEIHGTTRIARVFYVQQFRNYSSMLPAVTVVAPVSRNSGEQFHSSAAAPCAFDGASPAGPGG